MFHKCFQQLRFSATTTCIGSTMSQYNERNSPCQRYQPKSTNQYTLCVCVCVCVCVFVLTCAVCRPVGRRWGTLVGTVFSSPRRWWLCTWRWSWAATGGPVPSRTDPWGSPHTSRLHTDTARYHDAQREGTAGQNNMEMVLSWDFS